jgi:hypothetical protein
MQSPGGGGERRRPLPPPFGGGAAPRAGSPTRPPPAPAAPSPLAPAAPAPLAPAAPSPPPPAALAPLAPAAPAPLAPAALAPLEPRRSRTSSPPPSGPGPAPAPQPAPASRPTLAAAAAVPAPVRAPARVPAPDPGPDAPTIPGPPPSAVLPLRAPSEGSSGVADHGTPSLAPDRPWLRLARVSARRAFRNRIDARDVLPDERAAVTLASPRVVDPGFQAFLAWRRSVLLVVAVLLIPLTALRLVDVFTARGTPAALRALQTLPIAVEAGFCVLAWLQLRHWVSWHKQRRILLWGFVATFLAPFVVYLAPIRALVGAGADPSLAVVAGLGFSIQALLALLPRAVAVMPGVIRGATVTKLLLPGAAAPGWLMLLAAPLYGLVACLALILPYQITGSGFFVATILSLVGAQIFLGRAGYALARPQPHAEAAAIVARARGGHTLCMVAAGAFALLALAELVDQLQLGALAVVDTVASFLIYVLVLTLITADAIIAGLDRARGLTVGSPIADDYQRQLASFVGAAGERRSP